MLFPLRPGNAAKHPTVHGAALVTKDYLVQTVNRAKVRNPGLRYMSRASTGSFAEI